MDRERLLSGSELRGSGHKKRKEKFHFATYIRIRYRLPIKVRC